MKRKIISLSLIVIMIICLFILTGCGNKEKNDSKDYACISIGDKGSTVNYETYMILDEDIVKYKYSESEDDSKYKDVLGYTLNVNYYFEGIKEGKTEIWVMDIYPGQINSIVKYEVSVDNNLNAKIVNSTKQYTRIKCGYIQTNNKDSQVNIEDESIARAVYTGRAPLAREIIGLKEGKTSIVVKEIDGTEKKYTVKVDADLNVVLE